MVADSTFMTLCRLLQIVIVGEPPLLLVGLIDGGVELVEVLRSSVGLPHELQTNKIEESTRGKDKN